jgi:probable addiction module antidote protein
MIKKSDVELTDFWESFAGRINSPKKLKEFEKAVNKIYDMTGDESVFLTALKIIALTKGNVSKLAKDSQVNRRSIYNFFKKNANPTFKNFMSVSKNLGVSIHFSL